MTYYVDDMYDNDDIGDIFIFGDICMCRDLESCLLTIFLKYLELIFLSTKVFINVVVGDKMRFWVQNLTQRFEYEQYLLKWIVKQN